MEAQEQMKDKAGRARNTGWSRDAGCDALGSVASKRRASVGFRLARQGQSGTGSSTKRERVQKFERVSVVERNTAKNSGYRYVVLVADGGGECSVDQENGHERKVRFSSTAPCGVHNDEEPLSILLPPPRPGRLPRKGRREEVHVESLGQEMEGESSDLGPG